MIYYSMAQPFRHKKFFLTRSAKLKFCQNVYYVMPQLNTQRKWHRNA